MTEESGTESLELTKSALVEVGQKIEARSRRYRSGARFYTLLTIISLAICLGLFVGADRLSEYLFTSQLEREARARLIRAQAQLTTAVADLAPSAAEVIRSLPEKARAM